MSKRTGLKVVQPSAAGDNIIVGNERLSLEGDIKKQNSSSQKKKKSSVFSVYQDSSSSPTFQDKSTNTETTSGSVELSPADLTQESPSEGYWKELAESRRQALTETLEENEQLHKSVKSLTDRVKELEEESLKYEELAKHSEHLADTIQMLIASQEAPDDVGSDSEESKELLSTPE